MPKRSAPRPSPRNTPARRPAESPSPVRLVRDLAYVEVASTELAREINRDIILELIRAHQPVARVDLVRLSSLQNSTVSSIVEQLVAEGWIREGDAVKTARGRRPTRVSLNDNLAMLVAVVHPGRADIAAVDLNGAILSRSSLALAPEPKNGLRDLAAALHSLRQRHPGKSFEGAGICLPGRIDTHTRRLILAPNLRWQDLDIRAALSAKLGMQVELENDANACLLSQLWFGRLDGVRNAVLLAISEGVGASLLADGHIICGRLGMAGEFGHIAYDPAGPLCGCGRRGCWEVFASSHAALRYYAEAPARSHPLVTSPTPTPVDYPELCRRAHAGDPAAIDAIQQQATAIGRGLRMVTASLSPDAILFAGEITFAWPLIEPILARECERTLLAGDCPRLLCTGDGEVAHLLGAAAVVLQRHSGYYRSRSTRIRSHGSGSERTA